MSGRSSVFPKSRRRLLQPGINLTPLLDVIFNLIFFFLLATTLRQDEVANKVRLPDSDSTLEAAGESPTIVLDEEGKIFFKGNEISEEELKIEIAALVASGVTLIGVRADEEAKIGTFARITGICQAAGLEAVELIANKAK